MIVAGNQPYFFPYIAYWQLIKSADIFIIGDDYAYIKNGWIHRNRILNNGNVMYFGLDISKPSSFRAINKTSLLKIDRDKKLRILFEAYHKAPYYKTGIKLAEEILSDPETNLSDFLVSSMKKICGFLDIDTEFVMASSFTGNSAFKKEFRIYDFCKRLGGNVFINPIGGTKLYDFDEFENHGITLKFIKSGDIRYKQFGDVFYEKLSILDMIMFVPREKIIEELDNYTFIENENRR